MAKQGIDRNKEVANYETQLLLMYYALDSELKDILIKALKNPNSGTGSITYLAALKKQVRQVITAQLAQAERWSRESTDKIYREAVRLVDKDIEKVGVTALGSFGKINKDAIALLAENTYGRLQDATTIIGRSVDDELRKMGLAAIRGSVGGYKSVQTVKRELRDQIKDKMGGFVTYKNGRKVEAKTYAEVVARTSTAECHRTATQNRILETFDGDLVEIVGPLDDKTRPACEEAVGHLYSIEGRTPGYPLLEDYISKGGFGVNCRHDNAVTEKVIEEYEKAGIDY